MGLGALMSGGGLVLVGMKGQPQGSCSGASQSVAVVVRFKFYS